MNNYPDIQGKVMSLTEAVQKFIRNGSPVALGGFTVSRNPMAVASREAARGGRGHGLTIDRKA